MREEAHTNERFISCDGHKLYAFKGLGVDIEVGEVRYIEMHHEPQTLLVLLVLFKLCAIACARIGVWCTRLHTC